jgi:hypothetical protein
VLAAVDAGAQVRVVTAAGKLTVPMARTFPFDAAPDAFVVLTSAHPPGKLALINDPVEI